MRSCDNPVDGLRTPAGCCGKPRELEVGDCDGTFEGFGLEGIHGLFNIKMPPGKGMPAAKGQGRNDTKGVM